MEVLIIKKDTFDVIQKSGVSSITFSNNNYVIVSSSTFTYSAADYDIRIIS